MNTNKEYIDEKNRLNDNLKTNQAIAQDALNRFVSIYPEWSYECTEGTEDDFKGLDYCLTRNKDGKLLDIACSFRVRTTDKYNNFMIRKSGKYGNGEKSEYSKISNGTTKSKVYIYYCQTNDKLVLIETKLIGEFLVNNKQLRQFTGKDGSTFVAIDHSRLKVLAKQKKMMLIELPL